MQPSKFIQAAIDEHCKQREKYTLKQDIEADDLHPFRLGDAARKLPTKSEFTPNGFDKEHWQVLIAKPQAQRDTIAAAMLLSQIEVSHEKRIKSTL